MCIGLIVAIYVEKILVFLTACIHVLLHGDISVLTNHKANIDCILVSH